MVLGKQAMTFNQWSDALGKSHWKIEECKSYICSDLLWHWDIGLRPMSSAFISHLARISEDERLIFKQEWIESLDELFQGFLNAQDVMEDEQYMLGMHCMQQRTRLNPIKWLADIVLKGFSGALDELTDSKVV